MAGYEKQLRDGWGKKREALENPGVDKPIPKKGGKPSQKSFITPSLNPY